MTDQIPTFVAEAKTIVNDHCHRLIKTLAAMDHVEPEKTTFLRFCAAQNLGASIDLFLEIEGIEGTAALVKMMSGRIEAKTFRDGEENRAKMN